jgi:hemoglobin
LNGAKDKGHQPYDMKTHCVLNNETFEHKSFISAARFIVGFLAMILVATSGCGGGKKEKQKDEFFTSGSREADQRASQRMAKEKQLSGSGEGSGEKDAKQAGDGKGAEVEGKLSLFERLGGATGIAAIIDDFIPRAMADPRVNWERQGVKRGGVFRTDKSPVWNPTPENVANLKKHFVQFLTLATGGPVQYDGKEMKAAHSGMKIANPEFDAAVGDLKASLDKLKIANKEQKELLAILESTRPQIVTER